MRTETVSDSIHHRTPKNHKIPITFHNRAITELDLPPEFRLIVSEWLGLPETIKKAITLTVKSVREKK